MTRVKMKPQSANYDFVIGSARLYCNVDAEFDDGMYCHVAVTIGGKPVTSTYLESYELRPMIAGLQYLLDTIDSNNRI